jgi:histidinol-phosphate aminotransferase
VADKEFLHHSLELNARGLRFLTSALRQLGLQVVPSEANFVMVVLQDEPSADRIAGELLKQGVIVRPLRAFGLPHCVRISTGTDEDNHICVDAMNKALTSRVAV